MRYYTSSNLVIIDQNMKNVKMFSFYLHSYTVLISKILRQKNMKE